MPETLSTAEQVYTWYLHETGKIDSRYAFNRRSLTAKWKANRMEHSTLMAQSRNIDRGKLDVPAEKLCEIVERMAVLDGEEQEILDSKEELKEAYQREKASLQNQKEQMLKTLKR